MWSSSDYNRVVQKVSERYKGISVIGARFARSKLKRDPVYRQVLELLPSGKTLIDIGCGQGLMLALLVEARASRFDRMIGIETRGNVVRLAQAALGQQAEIVQADVRTIELQNCSTVLLFDVLQMMPGEGQEKLIRALSEKLAPHGVIFVREADASAGWTFRLVSLGNRVKAILLGRWSQTFHYRSRENWFQLFGRMELEAELCQAATRDPLGNILFRVRKRL